MNDDLKLINAKDLEDHIKSFAGMFTDNGFMVRLEAVLGAIDLMKPAVVRCKGCEHKDKPTCPVVDNLWFTDKDFCSWAKMKGTE